MKAEEADRLREEAAEAEKVAAEAKGCADKMESAANWTDFQDMVKLRQKKGVPPVDGQPRL